MPRFAQNLRIPGPTVLPPAVMAAGGRQMINHRGPEFAALLRADRPPHAAVLRHRRRDRRPHRRGHGRPRGCRRQRPLARRSGRRRDRRGLRGSLREGGRGLRRRRPPPRGRVGPGRDAGRGARRPARRAGRQGRAADPQRDLHRRHEPDPRAGRRDPRRRPRGPHPRRRDQRARRGPLRDGRLGPRPRRHRLAEGLDERPRHWPSPPSPSAPGRPWRPRGCRASTSTCGAPARARPAARRPGRRPSPSCTRSTKACASWRRRRPTASSPATRRAPRRLAPGLLALGFSLLADPAHASQTVTAAWVPEDLDWKAFNGELKRRGLVVAGGQGKLKGRIFRIGHLGSVEVEEILGAIARHGGGRPAPRSAPSSPAPRSRQLSGPPSRSSRRPALLQAVAAGAPA